MARLSRWDAKRDGITVDELREQMRKTMQTHSGVFRTEAVLQEGLGNAGNCCAPAARRCCRHSKVFNTARIEALELENLMAVARATLVSAAARRKAAARMRATITRSATTSTG